MRVAVIFFDVQDESVFLVENTVGAEHASVTRNRATLRKMRECLQGGVNLLLDP